MLIDPAVAHVLLTLLASTTAAWAVTALSVLGMGLMAGHYRASGRCSVSLDADTVYLRYGLSLAVGLQRRIRRIDPGLDKPTAFLNEFERLRAMPEPGAPAPVHAANSTTDE